MFRLIGWGGDVRSQVSLSVLIQPNLANDANLGVHPKLLACTDVRNVIEQWKTDVIQWWHWLLLQNCTAEFYYIIFFCSLGASVMQNSSSHGPSVSNTTGAWEGSECPWLLFALKPWWCFKSCLQSKHFSELFAMGVAPSSWPCGVAEN